MGVGQWADLDLPGRGLAVRGSLHRDPGGGWTIREPKTERSRRQVLLPPMAAKALQAHRLRQNAERLHAGPLWEENGLATLLLAEGVHPKMVSEMLGHTEVGITLNLYSHVMPAMHESATGALGRLLDQPGHGREQDGPGNTRSLP